MTDLGPGLACLRCKTELRSSGVQKFRTGGAKGAARLFLGEWGELGEDLIPLEVLDCPSCGYVELRVPRR